MIWKHFAEDWESSYLELSDQDSFYKEILKHL